MRSATAGRRGWGGAGLDCWWARTAGGAAGQAGSPRALQRGDGRQPRPVGAVGRACTLKFSRLARWTMDQGHVTGAGGLDWIGLRPTRSQRARGRGSRQGQGTWAVGSHAIGWVWRHASRAPAAAGTLGDTDRHGTTARRQQPGILRFEMATGRPAGTHATMHEIARTDRPTASPHVKPALPGSKRRITIVYARTSSEGRKLQAL